jgi:hypothetical protein
VPNLPRPGQSPRTNHHHRLTLAVTGVEMYDGALFLRYEVVPVPDVIAADAALHDGSGAGIAIDERHRVFDDCSSAYRRSHDGTRVVGVVRFRSLPTAEDVDLAILFSPLAHTKQVHRHLCQVRLRLQSGKSTVRSVRLV